MPAYVPNSYREYVSNGTTTTVVVPFPYLRRAHVGIYRNLDIGSGEYSTKLVDGIDYTWVNDTTITLTPALALGQVYTIRRATPGVTPLVVWSDASTLTARDLNLADTQLFYFTQEQLDVNNYLAIQGKEAAQKADTALARVQAALPYAPVVNVAGIPTSPADDTRIEIRYTTGLESFSPITGRPVTFVGSESISARLGYSTSLASWVWIDYFRSDPDARYINDAQPTVIYVDPLNGDDALDGHRIRDQKRTIRAAVAACNDGDMVSCAPGVYKEILPIDITKINVTIKNDSQRTAFVLPAVGYETQTMFRCNSGTQIDGFTFAGLKASGTRGGHAIDSDPVYGLPTNQGWVAGFLPGAVIRKSPYVNNCTLYSDSEINVANFDPNNYKGTGGDRTSAPCGGGILVDGFLPSVASPLRGFVCNEFTLVGLDGPGILVANNGYIQAVNSFGIFCHYHVKALSGGQVNMEGGCTDFGRYGLIADGKSATAIFTAPASGSAAAGALTFAIGAPVASASWFGSATRPAKNMLVEIGSNLYSILSATAAGTGWNVTISRPNPSNRSQNLGLIAAHSDGASVSFFLRSMISAFPHTFEYAGSGTDYTALPENGGVPIDANQAVERNDGRVWIVGADQNGKFRVGDTFTVDQETGFVQVNPSAFSPANTTLLGGVRLASAATLRAPSILAGQTDGERDANNELNPEVVTPKTLNYWARERGLVTRRTTIDTLYVVPDSATAAGQTFNFDGTSATLTLSPTRSNAAIFEAPPLTRETAVTFSAAVAYANLIYSPEETVNYQLANGPYWVSPAAFRHIANVIGATAQFPANNVVANYTAASTKPTTDVKALHDARPFLIPLFFTSITYVDSNSYFFFSASPLQLNFKYGGSLCAVGWASLLSVIRDTANAPSTLFGNLNLYRSGSATIQSLLDNFIDAVVPASKNLAGFFSDPNVVVESGVFRARDLILGPSGTGVGGVGYGVIGLTIAVRGDAAIISGGIYFLGNSKLETLPKAIAKGVPISAAFTYGIKNTQAYIGTEGQGDGWKVKVLFYSYAFTNGQPDGSADRNLDTNCIHILDDNGNYGLMSNRADTSGLRGASMHDLISLVNPASTLHTGGLASWLSGYTNPNKHYGIAGTFGNLSANTYGPSGIRYLESNTYLRDASYHDAVWQMATSGAVITGNVSLAYAAGRSQSSYANSSDNALNLNAKAFYRGIDTTTATTVAGAISSGTAPNYYFFG